MRPAAGSVAELMAAIERVAAGGSYVDPGLDPLLLRSRARVPQLSPREREILHRMAKGKNPDELNNSFATIRARARNALRKLRRRDR
jgi:DNA-binding NarL/FixJ family response regulator